MTRTVNWDELEQMGESELKEYFRHKRHLEVTEEEVMRLLVDNYGLPDGSPLTVHQQGAAFYLHLTRSHFEMQIKVDGALIQSLLEGAVPEGSLLLGTYHDPQRDVFVVRVVHPDYPAVRAGEAIPRQRVAL